MKTLYLSLVLLLLIWYSQSRIGFGIVGPFGTTAFTCLQSTLSSDTYAIIRTYKHSPVLAGIDSNSLQTFINAYNAGFTADPYIELCRGIDPALQVLSVQSTILAQLQANGQSRYGSFFYLKVQQTSNSNCSWNGYSTVDNCIFLKAAVNAVQSIGGWNPTIYTTANIWSKFFAHDCDTFASDTGSYVSYALYNSSGLVTPAQTFSDFVPFGGFTSPLVKQVGGNLTIPLLCGSIPWHAFVDKLYYP